MRVTFLGSTDLTIPRVQNPVPPPTSTTCTYAHTHTHTQHCELIGCSGLVSHVIYMVIASFAVAVAVCVCVCVCAVVCVCMRVCVYTCLKVRSVKLRRLQGILAHILCPVPCKRQSRHTSAARQSGKASGHIACQYSR